MDFRTEVAVVVIVVVVVVVIVRPDLGDTITFRFEFECGKRTAAVYIIKITSGPGWWSTG